MKRLVTIAIFATVGCADLHPRTVSDAARDLCEAVFSRRPEIVRQAKQQGLSPIDIAKAACAANAVLEPFLTAGRNAGDDAMGSAQRMGIVR